MTPVDTLFQKLRQTGRKAFMPFVTAGDPDLDLTAEVIRELDRRDYRMLDFIARGAMLRDVEYVLGAFGYEPRLALIAWAASRLLVAG